MSVQTLRNAIELVSRERPFPLGEHVALAWLTLLGLLFSIVPAGYEHDFLGFPRQGWEKIGYFILVLSFSASIVLTVALVWRKVRHLDKTTDQFLDQILNQSTEDIVRVARYKETYRDAIALNQSVSDTGGSRPSVIASVSLETGTDSPAG